MSDSWLRVATLTLIFLFFVNHLCDYEVAAQTSERNRCTYHYGSKRYYKIEIDCSGGYIHLTRAEIRFGSYYFQCVWSRCGCNDWQLCRCPNDYALRINIMGNNNKIDRYPTVPELRRSTSCPCANSTPYGVSLRYAYKCSDSSNTTPLCHAITQTYPSSKEGYLVFDQQYTTTTSSPEFCSCRLHSSDFFNLTLLRLDTNPMMGVSLHMTTEHYALSKLEQYVFNQSLIHDLNHWNSDETTVYPHLKRAEVMLLEADVGFVFVYFKGNGSSVVDVECGPRITSPTTSTTSSTPTSVTVPTTFSAASDKDASRASNKAPSIIGGVGAVVLVVLLVAVIIIILKRKGKLPGSRKANEGNATTSATAMNNPTVYCYVPDPVNRAGAINRDANFANQEYELENVSDSNATDNAIYETFPGGESHYYASVSDDAGKNYDRVNDHTYDYASPIVSALPSDIHLQPNDLYQGDNDESPHVSTETSKPHDLDIQRNDLYD